jgi:fatty-acyl-CoA synthase
LDSLETAVTGGAPMTKSLLDGFARHGVNLLQGWGMTETSPNVSLSRPPRETDGTAQAIPYLMSAGRLNAMVDARLVGAEGKELPWDGSAAGEIQLSSPHAASGYFRNPAAGDELMDGAWLRTGDLATIDPSGYVRLKDRMKDLIKSGGEWIPTAELEEVIRSSPGVVDIAVVARPDERWGERPVAFVVAQVGSSIDVAELREYLKSRVPRWWVPDTFEVIDSLPLTSVGQVDKKALRNQVSAV